MASPATEPPAVATVAADALTINEAAETTGWSARMLRYIESVGLIVPPRSGGGYRLYGPGELQRLRTLRELLKGSRLEIADVAFIQRLRSEPAVEQAVAQWLDQTPEKPAEVTHDDWLSFEQRKHQQLLDAINNRPNTLPDS